MNRALLDGVLHGGVDAFAAFGDAEHCAVIDWRDGPAEIVAAVASFLPPNHLTLGRHSETECELVVTAKAPKSVLLSPAAKQEMLLLAINEALQPEFELRQFRPFDGDGYSIFVAPRSVWSEIQRAQPQAVDRLFLTMERLAAYWRRGYFARLFSKP